MEIDCPFANSGRPGNVADRCFIEAIMGKEFGCGILYPIFTIIIF
jgi:hypothetical protein